MEIYFENVKIIPKPGYIIKSATWNDSELTILQDEDTVGKVSLPALKEDAALTVSFEQAEVEQEAQFPDDIEIVFLMRRMKIPEKYQRMG